MGKFRITVTDRRQEWSEERDALTCAIPEPGRSALSCGQVTNCNDTPGYGRSALSCGQVTNCNQVDTRGYGDAPQSPLT